MNTELFYMLLFCCLVTQTRPFLQPQGLYPSRHFCPWDFPGKNTGAGCHFLLQGIFLTQRSNLCLVRLLLWQANSNHWATWEVHFYILDLLFSNYGRKRLYFIWLSTIQKNVLFVLNLQITINEGLWNQPVIIN